MFGGLHHKTRLGRLLTAALAAAGACAAATLPPLDRAQWIWAAETDSTCELRTGFTLDGQASSATALITADNGYELFVNGSHVGSDVGAGEEVWRSVERYDIGSRLVKGKNFIGIHGVDLGGVRGVIAAFRVEIRGRPPVELVTDDRWRAATEGPPVLYSHPEFVEGPEWTAARVVGPMGVAPWGRLQWSPDAEKARAAAAPKTETRKPGAEFNWPGEVAFVGDDCSVYVPLRGDAWGVAFRVGDWSRAYTEFDLPCPSKIGRKLLALKPGPGAKPRVLHDAGSGVVGSPSAAFDGRSLLVAMARPGEKFFHIHRVPLDGGEPRRLTDGPFHDIDPVELPDGRILFTSTRVGTFEEYHQPPSRTLFRMNADGGGIELITATPIFDNEPKVTADGRVSFIRTDNFFSRGKVETHLHSIRPDGTDGFVQFAADVGADYGVRLRAFGYGSPAPLPDGRLAFISNHGNFAGAGGASESGLQRLPGGVGDLAPLPDGRLLCTVLRPEGRKMTSDVLGVLDPADNSITAVFESRSGSIHSPISLVPRPRPPAIPDYADAARAARTGATGFLFCKDARFTTKGKADWNRIRAVRILAAAPLTIRSSHSHIVHVGHETIELGSTPLAADGSFSVEVPADVPLAIQAVDAEGRSELNEMSWLYVRPGEHRSCSGCHQPRESAPAFAGAPADALRAPPVKLLGQGDPHRFRGNNPGVTGMMDLQFERFRECASLNRNVVRDPPDASRREEIDALIAQLRGPSEDLRISAAQRLAIFREHRAAPALAEALGSGGREARLAAALSLSACGVRGSVEPLIRALSDRDVTVARAAAVALENLTGRSGAEANPSTWYAWLTADPWTDTDARLVDGLREGEPARRASVVAIGHVGGDRARVALRAFVREHAGRNPYPKFEKDNRTDTFTFPAASPLNPRTLQEAVRALGHLGEAEDVPLLAGLLSGNLSPTTGNLFLAEACAEALGRIGGTAAETALLDAFSNLGDYWDYVGWYSDHPALYACHSSPVHARILEALDALGSSRAGPLAARIIQSVPTDPDRGLFAANDDYETLAGRLIRRSGREREVVDACLALLGDRSAKASPDLRAALSSTHPAWAGTPGPENRSAQILSLGLRDPALEPAVRAAFARFRDKPEEPVSRTLGNPTWTPVRHWTLFYLARTLGNLRNRASVETLGSALSAKLNEARHGRPDPSQPEIHLLQLEYTPCWRAAAAWALGEIGDRRARPALVAAVTNLDNAVDVRHSAARALGKMAVRTDAAELARMAGNCPEISVRKALLAAATQSGGAGDAYAKASPHP
jgi:HEAT repeat protein